MGKTDTEVKKAETVDCIYNPYTPCHFTHEGKEYNLVQGQSYTLPTNPFTDSLIEQGRLTVKK